MSASPAVLPQPSPTYEQLLAADPRWALQDASRFFEGGGAVNQTLRVIAGHLDELKIPYAVCGGMALFAHGYRRFTEDVDILVTREGLKQIHEQLVGRGYLPPFENSKHLRDTATKVKVEFLTTGQYPGDGKPKPIIFPDPTIDFVVIDGIRYTGIKTLIELKLASGMTGQARGKDLVDVQELMRVLNLPQNYSQSLHPMVAAKYEELWAPLHADRRYVRIWRTNASSPILSFDQLMALVPADAALIRQMQAEGVVIDPDAGSPAGVIRLITFNPVLAAKYDMLDERDLLDSGDSAP